MYTAGYVQAVCRQKYLPGIYLLKDASCSLLRLRDRKDGV
jgi:hypothetical protein